MMANDAFVSLMDIANSWMLRNGKTIHAKYMVLKHAADAVRELQLTSLAMVKHKLLYREEGKQWWELPKDFSDWVSAGVRAGQRWKPVGISSSLMPMPQTYAPAEFNSEYSTEFNQGEWGNWMNGTYAKFAGAFDSADFDSADFTTEDGGTLTSTGYGFAPLGYGGGTGYGYAGGAYSSLYPVWWGDYIISDLYTLKGQRMDEVVINAAKGVIMCPQGFPSTELYLVYVGIGTADTMTYIPVQAQAAIEAYISWQWQANKKNGVDKRGLQRDFEFQHQILRSRLLAENFTVETLYGIFDKKYNYPDRYDGRGIGAGDTINTGGLTPDPLPSVGYLPQQYYVGIPVAGGAPPTAITVLAGATITDPLLIGATLWPIMVFAGTNLEWGAAGVTFNSATGTLDFTAIGGVNDTMIITVSYLPA